MTGRIIQVFSNFLYAAVSTRVDTAFKNKRIAPQRQFTSPKIRGFLLGFRGFILAQDGPTVKMILDISAASDDFGENHQNFGGSI